MDAVFGTAVPRFSAASSVNPEFHFGSVGGMPAVIAFAGCRMSARQVLTAWPGLAGTADALPQPYLFLVLPAAVCAAAEQRIDLEQAAHGLPRCILFFDNSQALAEQFGAFPFPESLILQIVDRGQRGLCRLAGKPADLMMPLALALARLGNDDTSHGAPVLVLPRIFEPAFCTELLAYAATLPSEAGGVMAEVDGITRIRQDFQHKRRKDVVLIDEGWRAACRLRLARRLVPEVRKAFGYQATYVERYLLGSYFAGDGSRFRPHRDNTTRGTAHRGFAVSLELDPQAYEGGGVRFPEYSPTAIKAPLGGAVVFSCSLLHEALPVTAGVRQVFLPFLYDDAGAQLRERNLGFVEERFR